MYKFLMSTVVAGTMALATNVYAACGSISMADMNWPSATLMANVDKIILEAVSYTHLTLPTKRIV